MSTLIQHRIVPALALLIFLVAGCANPTTTVTLPTDVPNTSTANANPTFTPPETEDDTRTLLTYEDLTGGFEYISPVDNAALTIPADATPPDHIFEGRLELIGEDSAGEMLVLFGDPDVEPEVPHLPEFDFAFVQSGDYLVPVQRGLIIADHPYWNLILEPGRVWKEESDPGYSRASLPFALVWKGSNAIFNGVMTFLFNDESVSKVWYQVTQETTVSLKADMWGLLEAAYHPGPAVGSLEVRAAFDQEMSARFPTKPIEQLAEDYPGVDITAFGRGVTPEFMTWYGFVVNGVNYMGGCQTRYGAYPYCEAMRAPSYSTAKSAFVSAALMRLAQKYGPDVPNLLIRDYVPEAADSPGDWSGVTFNHTLDMATGNYRSARFMVDEESWDTDPFWSAEYYSDIIAAAFNWPHSAPPGTQWVYRTSDTFIVTRALHNYLQTMEDPDADIYRFVVEEIYKPLEISPGTYTVLRTKDNGWQGQPYGGLGQWWIPDDLAKVTTLMNVDDGMIDGKQILDPDLLAATLQRNPDDRGVDIDSGRKYNNAFWANVYKRGYDCEVWVPQMLGYSGIVVALFPNGTTYYYASDNREFTWEAVLGEANKIFPLCPQETTYAPTPTPSSEIQPLVTGSITDVDGNVYQTVQLGSQWWMAASLNVTNSPNGETITGYCYDDHEENCAIYGRLYTWISAMNGDTAERSQGICPHGWHIPSDGEWSQLFEYLGGEAIAGGKMKAAGTEHWVSPNAGATNTSGFTGLPAGGFNPKTRQFEGLGIGVHFWSSTEDGPNAGLPTLHYQYESVLRLSEPKTITGSVRCTRD